VIFVASPSICMNGLELAPNVFQDEVLGLLGLEDDCRLLRPFDLSIATQYLLSLVNPL